MAAQRRDPSALDDAKGSPLMHQGEGETEPPEVLRPMAGPEGSPVMPHGVDVSTLAAQVTQQVMSALVEQVPVWVAQALAAREAQPVIPSGPPPAEREAEVRRPWSTGVPKGPECTCPQCPPHRKLHWICCVCGVIGDYRRGVPTFTHNVLDTQGWSGFANHCCSSACESEYRRRSFVTRAPALMHEGGTEEPTGAAPEELQAALAADQAVLRPTGGLLGAPHVYR
jgi:hypothetical protein